MNFGGTMDITQDCPKQTWTYSHATYDKKIQMPVANHRRGRDPLEANESLIERKYKSYDYFI